MAESRAFLFFAVLTFFHGSCHSAKILINLTPQTQSHTMGMKRIAQEVSERGHEILFVMPDADIPTLRMPATTAILPYEFAQSRGPGSKELRLSSKHTQSDMLKMVNDMMSRACTGLMTNATLLSGLKEYRADVMLGESFYPCTPLLASRLDLSWVGYFAAAPIEPYMTAIWPECPRRHFVPNPLSYFPQMGQSTTSQFMARHFYGPEIELILILCSMAVCDVQTFTQRLENLWHYLHDAIQDAMIHRPFVLATYKQFGFDINGPGERQRHVLTLVPVDWAAEWVRPTPPALKFVGPILSAPGKPLPAELEDYMQGAGEEGVLLVALGTVTELGKEQRMLMAAEFGKLPCKVLWRLSNKEIPDEDSIAELGLADNTKVVRWLPQNDILAHPRTSAFLSHCGVNSMYEAIYHGKPIVALPFFGDQSNNADKLINKGMAVKVRLSNVKAGNHEMLDGITRVLTDGNYTLAARALSTKIKSHRRTPVQQAGDWIEHVVETKGDPYLKTPDDELSYIVRHNLDVYLAVAAFVGLLSFLALRLLRSVWRSVFGYQNIGSSGVKPAMHLNGKTKST